MDRSESITKLSAALVKAQSQIRPAIKDSENPHLRSKYADLASCWDACRDPLRVNGLAVVQIPLTTEGQCVRLETIVVHESGEWISGILTVPMPKADPQGLGSALSYARRYALTAFLGISTADDDGQAASLTSHSKATTTRAATPAPAPAPAAEKKAPVKAAGAKGSKRQQMLGRITELEKQLGVAGLGERVQAHYALLIGDERTIDDAEDDALAAYGRALRAELDAAVVAA